LALGRLGQIIEVSTKMTVMPSGPLIGHKDAESSFGFCGTEK
jgi:hypothetical protein